MARWQPVFCKSAFNVYSHSNFGSNQTTEEAHAQEFAQNLGYHVAMTQTISLMHNTIIHPSCCMILMNFTVDFEPYNVWKSGLSSQLTLWHLDYMVMSHDY